MASLNELACTCAAAHHLLDGAAMKPSLRSTLIASFVASIFVSACVDLPDDEDSLGDTESELSAWNWSTNYIQAGSSEHPAQVATLGTTTYLVKTEWDSTNMYWQKRKADGTWTTKARIPKQRTMDRPSLAAFNGYLYMVHVGESDGSRVWFSRFDPATETWTPNILLPFTTDGGPPALAAFDNRLFMVGIDYADDGTYPMWVATMNSSETWTDATGIRRQWSASRPSLAVFRNTLYMAHRNGATGEIVLSTHGAGAAANTWTTASYIRAGASGAAIQGNDVSLAAVNGYLHLVHRRFDTEYTWWTYFDGCTWAPEVMIDTLRSGHPLSLTASSEGLVLARGKYWEADLGLSWSYTNWTNTYTAPPAPERIPQCLGTI